MTTFNPSDIDSSCSLSGGNLTITKNTGDGSPTGGRATNSPAHTSGKSYFEMTVAAIEATSSGRVSLGIANSSEVLNAELGQSTFGVGCIIFNSGGNLQFYLSYNGPQQDCILSSVVMTAPSVFGICVDNGAETYWVNGWTVSSGWTNAGATNFTGNPATATGGFSYSGMSLTGGVMPMATMFYDTGAVTLNTAGPFTGTIPSGFSAWDTASAVNCTRLLLGVGCGIWAAKKIEENPILRRRSLILPRR
jgi:hypothetical protein